MDLRQSVENVIKDTINRFQEKPFDFLYESDIQGFLFTKLYEGEYFSTNRVEIKSGKFSNDNFAGRDFIESSLVKTEYPGDYRFDIAIIDKDSVQHFSEYARNNPNKNLKNEVFWCQQVIVGVEIKMFRLGKKMEYSLNEIMKDIEKMKNYAGKERFQRDFLGTGLLFVQSYSKSILERINDKVIESTLKLADGIQGWVISPEKCYRINRGI